MKLLLFGKSGQVGAGLLRQLPGLGALTALDRSAADLCYPEQLEAAIKVHHPDIVVNAAAYTAVDRAETEPALATAVNAYAPGVMADAARTIGALFIHYSTDYVFDGNADRPYLEDHPTAPGNVYGRSKLEGERAVTAAAGSHLILRTGWVYSNHGRNFLDTMLRLARERKELRVVDDQFGGPTYAALIAKATAEVIRTLWDDGAAGHSSGVYHMSCGGVASWYEFAAAIFERAGLSALRLKPVPTSDYPTPAKRPRYSVLDNSKLLTRFGVQLPKWRVGLDRCLVEADVVDKR